MNFSASFLLGESLFVSLIALIFIGLARWRKRKRLFTELSGLLERVNRAEPERQRRLQARLMETSGLDEDEAESLSIETIRSERNLFKTFTEIQLGAEFPKAGSFDQCVYALLDHYSEVIAIVSANPEPKSQAARNPGQAIEALEDLTVQVDREPFDDRSGSASGTVETGIERAGLDEAGPDPGESGDRVEPNWDDAFAEAAQGHEGASTDDERCNDTAAG
ncbi:MAG: hypothetical protein L0Y38_06340 [Methylococcaceae bacterium]|nr:hypothetical protein [Methylococcaceae bacterium]MCI0667286.1 hypothetical protein [Methylococcaceae bacterium]MCI0733426.1 hypothetical protein [Methylococcaceae bacterium]